MEDIRKHAKQLLEDLNTIESGDLKKKIRLQEKMKKIIGLGDNEISSKEMKDLNRMIICHKDIQSVYEFFINYPEFEEKAGKFFE